MKVDFLGPSFDGRSLAVDPSRSINLYPEVVANPSAKSTIILIGTPGLEELFPTTDGAIPRAGGLYNFNGVLYIVAGNSLMSWNGTTLSILGHLNTDSGPVSIVDNGVEANGVGGNQLAIADGNSLYVYNISTLTFTTKSSSDIGFVPVMLTYLDGYIIGMDGSMSFWSSDLYAATTWNALAVASAVGTTDNLAAISSYLKQLYAIKGYSTEVWYNSGQATSSGSPFSRAPGIPIDVGTSSPWSVALGGGSLFFIGNQQQNTMAEMVGVVQMSGYQAQVISPASMVVKMQKLGKTALEAAIGYCYSDEGHSFYVITIGDWTAAYDITTGMWHERSTYRETDAPGVTGKHIGISYTRWNGKHTVGSCNSAKVFEMGSSFLTDDGKPIRSVRIAPILVDDENFEDLFFYRFFIDMEVGGTTDPTADPKAMLSWSDDGGYTWSSEYEASIGKQGEYMTRLIWRKLGYSFNRVFRLAISDEVKKILVGAYADISL